MNIRHMIFVFAILCFSAGSLPAKDKTITVKLTVPDTAFDIKIDEVVLLKNELYVISIVSREPGEMGADVISTVQSSVTVDLDVPDVVEKHFILGKSWAWKGKEKYTFLKDRSRISEKLKEGKVLYKKPVEQKK